MRITLGLGRGAGAKVAPWLFIALAVLPVLVVIVIASFAASLGGDEEDFDLPSYPEYYEFAIIPIGLFAAIVTPLLLCPDRRDGVLSLYAARPIAPADYVGARWAGGLTVTAVMAWFPALVLMVWNILDAESTTKWLEDDWDVLPRLLAAGLAVAAPFTTLALLCASFTARRAYAAVATLAVLFVGAAVGGIAEGDFDGDIADAVSLVNLPQAVIDAVRWIFAEEVLGRPISGAVSTAWVGGATAAFGAALYLRTRALMRA